ncbi:gamma-interferon-responsive lysosomal thiol protein-like isoform X2 [Punica granatum]|uniref:Gamma-interferon-responsive lysosomal thiol protein-like isoform X2 n=1 Tax=Punica granatum TaxID=22663 RepID=A0A6P8DXD7_PUNGR|nr:gamma-interferon-responsive lysosomal thiol protein-like isoform X2 [Punica granatum]
MGFPMSGTTVLYLILISAESILTHVESSVPTAPNWVRATAGPKVNLALYYESLCPYSAGFITNDLVKAVQTPDIERVINLRLVPWGNARVNRSTKAVLCQHGERECYLNTIHACAIQSWPDQKTHFEFISCIEAKAFEEYDSGSRETIWKTCCKQLELDTSLISKCYNSGLGTKLELHYGAETDRLSPPHKFVPWVVVNGQPISDYPNFMRYICLYYKGPTPPKACLKITPQST